MGRVQSRLAAVAALLLLAVAPASAWAQGFQASPDAMRAHVHFLADDLMRGREAGSKEYEVSALYVATRFMELGVKPAGENGTYMQTVPLLEHRLVRDGASASVRDARGGVRALTQRADWLPASWPGGDLTVSAPVVFAGFGIVDPARGRDDYAGLDVRGKIVAVFTGLPLQGFDSEERAHLSSPNTKRAFAAERGAVGVILIQSPQAERSMPFARMAAHQHHGWSMTWAEAPGRGFARAASAPALGTLSLAAAEPMFAGARRSWSRVLTAAETGDGRMRGFPLPVTLDVSVKVETRTVTSPNVVGLIEGSDPALKSEYVVLTAHLDHIGVTAPKNGDTIANGALDNAVGVATLLEVARGFREGPRPRRSILLIALTAEEKGLVGADYFARNPTVPKSAMVANVNLDMPVLTYDFIDVIAFGAERSTLGPMVRRAAERIGVGLTPDPMPEQNLFVRSDHYRFVEQGVPAVFLMTGFGGEGREKFTEFLRTRYHQPDDDLNHFIHWEAGAKFARLNYEIAREIADADERPRWTPGDFFGETFGKGR